VTEPGSVPEQRRQSVRARVRVPVTLTVDGIQLQGTTIDLSEGGAACAFAQAGLLPTSGSAVELTLRLDDVRIWLSGVVVQVVVRREWILTVQFLDVPERDQDVVRTHVFAVLRRERARGVR
jgi:c-di-GMP-binding flagellar brake protein YcgR